MSGGVGQARLDLGLSSGFLRAGPNRGRWMCAEGCDHGQRDHISREALRLAPGLAVKDHFNGVLLLSPPWRLLGHGQGTAAEEDHSRAGTAPALEEVPAACARWHEERCQSG